MFEFHATPLPFCSDALNQSLDTHWLGRQVCALAAVDSTNNYALRLSDDEAGHGLVVVAEEQTAGRGRFNRVWQSQPGKALLATIVLRGEAYLRVEGALTMAASVAVHHVLANLGFQNAEIRWPNDIVISEKKVCGILAERGPWCRPGWVLGIGLNISQREADFPEPLRPLASSLVIESKTVYTREMLLSYLARALEDTLDVLANEDHGPKTIRRQWEAASCAIGRTIAIDTGVETVMGMVVGIEPTGALVIRQPSGFLKTILSGTVLR